MPKTNRVTEEEWDPRKKSTLLIIKIAKHHVLVFKNCFRSLVSAHFYSPDLAKFQVKLPCFLYSESLMILLQIANHYIWQSPMICFLKPHKPHLLKFTKPPAPLTYNSWATDEIRTPGSDQVRDCPLNMLTFRELLNIQYKIDGCSNILKPVVVCSWSLSSPFPSLLLHSCIAHFLPLFFFFPPSHLSPCLPTPYFCSNQLYLKNFFLFCFSAH